MSRKNAISSSIPVTEPSILSSSQSTTTLPTGHEVHIVPDSQTVSSIPTIEPCTSSQGYLSVDSDIQIKEDPDIQLIAKHRWDNRAPLFQGLYAIKQEQKASFPKINTRFLAAGVPDKERKRLNQAISTYKSLNDDERESYLNSHMTRVICNDPEQPDLKNQDGVVATRDLDAWTLLGHYAGRVMTEEDFKTQDARLLGGTVLAINTYSVELGDKKLFLSGYRYGNITSLINANITHKYALERVTQHSGKGKGKGKEDPTLCPECGHKKTHDTLAPDINAHGSTSTSTKRKRNPQSSSTGYESDLLTIAGRNRLDREEVTGFSPSSMVATSTDLTHAPSTTRDTPPDSIQCQCPPANVCFLRHFVDDRCLILVLTCRTVKEREPLLFDYGMGYWREHFRVIDLTTEPDICDNTAITSNSSPVNKEDDQYRDEYSVAPAPHTPSLDMPDSPLLPSKYGDTCQLSTAEDVENPSLVLPTQAHRNTRIDTRQKRSTLKKIKCFRCSVCKDAFIRFDRLIVHKYRRHYLAKSSKPSNPSGPLKDHMRIHNQKNPIHSKISQTRFSPSDNRNRQQKASEKKFYASITASSAKDTSLMGPWVVLTRLPASGNGQFTATSTTRFAHEAHQPGDVSQPSTGAGYNISNTEEAVTDEIVDRSSSSTGVTHDFKCDICGKDFQWNSLLSKHMTTHGNERPFKCNICGKGFKLKRILVRHKKTHGNERPFQCDIYGKGFNFNYVLTKHKKTTHSERKPFKCDICGKDFKWKSDLTRHMKSHSERKPFKCDICGKDFKWKSDLTRHMKSHRNENPFKCDICGKDFKWKSDLTHHMKSHRNENPFKCDICGKDFKWKSNLTHHMTAHGNERPFQCNICGKGFKWNHNLTHHKKTHGNERPFLCDICGNDFKRKSNLTQHMKTHSEQKPLVMSKTG